jgi:hypothetical protein
LNREEEIFEGENDSPRTMTLVNEKISKESIKSSLLFGEYGIEIEN